MIQWNERLLQTTEEPVLSCTELITALALAVEHGADEQMVLRAAGLAKEALEHGSTRISIRRHYLALLAAASRVPDFPTQLARRLRPTTYGIAGYALLSSPSFKDAIFFVKRFSPLLNMKFSIDLVIEGSIACLRLRKRFAMDEAMLGDFLVFELAKLKVLFDDVFYGRFQLSGASCLCVDKARLEVLRGILGVPVFPAPTSNDDTIAEMRFDAGLLTRDLPMSHQRTHASSIAVCDSLMSNFSSSYDLERHVKDILRGSLGKVPAFTDIAKAMCMSQRTLRRRLEALNTSYKQILDEVRKELAINYVTTTHYTTETIAELLGYSEAANFRHAFKRWTGKSPRHFSHACDSDADEASCAPANSSVLGRQTRIGFSSSADSHSGRLGVAAAAWQ
jgi:AraC-like DNA-binding protein